MRTSRMTKITLLMLPLLFLLGCNGGGGDQKMSNDRGTEPQTSNDGQSAAKQGLAAFAKLVNAGNFKEMGFESADEIKNAVLGEPIKISMVKLDQLKEYQAGSDPNKLLSDMNRSIYPVLMKDQVRSAITVEGTNGKWQATGFGDSGLIKKIEEVRKKKPSTEPTRTPEKRDANTEKAEKPAATPGASPNASATPPAAEGQKVLVFVAFLNIYFVGEQVGGKLMLTNVTAVPGTKWAASETAPADEVFTALAAIAREYNGLPM